MLTMDQIHDIRFRFYEKGENVSQIAEALRLDWRTVRKYIDQNDFNEAAPKPAMDKKFCPKLDPYKALIDSWLIEDKSAPRKQRHTAKLRTLKGRTMLHGLTHQQRQRHQPVEEHQRHINHKKVATVVHMRCVNGKHQRYKQVCDQQQAVQRDGQ